MSEASIAAGTKNLIPLSTRNPEVHRIISQKGGQAKTLVKKDANKWRQVKTRLTKKGMTEEDQAWMLEKLTNRDAAAIDIYQYIDDIQNDIHPAQRVALANTLIAAGKFTHGEKIKTEAVNININSSQEEWERRMFEK
jgi:hypothetical protein